MRKKFGKSLAVLTSFVLLLTALSACSGSTTQVPSSAVSSAVSSAAPSASQAEVSSAAPAEQVELLVSAAASLTDVMKELGQTYSAKESNVKITYTFGSSGALQTQIEEGAPSDIFMSAAQKQMDALAQKSLLVDDTRKDLLVNEVVLITPKSSETVKSFDDVNTDKVKKIALGEPKSVPVGQYSEEIFTSLKCLDSVKKKAVYGSDVRQVLTWVESGDADCGVVYATDAATTDQVRIAANAPEGSHQPVVYPVSVLKSSKHAEAAKAFLDFLSTDEAKTVFEKYGFTVK